MSEAEFQPPARQERAVGAEIAVSRAMQEVQAACVLAKRFPRDPSVARQRLLAECAEIDLAEEAAYEFPRGGERVSGPSIRLAEAAARAWGNMESGVIELERRKGESLAMAFAWDFETNYRDVKTFTVKHWRDTKGGGYALTDERDIYEQVANQGARRKRACILGVIPQGPVNAALAECEKTLARAAKGAKLDERVDAMLVALGEYGVTPAQIETRLGHNLAAISEAELAKLRRCYASIRDGMVKATELFPPVADAPTDQHPGRAPSSPSDLADLAAQMEAPAATPVPPAAPPVTTAVVPPEGPPAKPRRARKPKAPPLVGGDDESGMEGDPGAVGPISVREAFEKPVAPGEVKVETNLPPASAPTTQEIIAREKATPAPAVEREGAPDWASNPHTWTDSMLSREADRLLDVKDRGVLSRPEQERLDAIWTEVARRSRARRAEAAKATGA